MKLQNFHLWSVAILLLSLLSIGQPSQRDNSDAGLPPPKVAFSHTSDSRGVTVTIGQQHLKLENPGLSSSSNLVDMQWVGTVGDAIILNDNYASNSANPIGYCGAGSEEFLRVLSTKPVLHETFRITMESCIHNIELQTQAESLMWDPKKGVLTLKWISGPAHVAKAETRQYRVNPNGKVQLLTQ